MQYSNGLFPLYRCVEDGGCREDGALCGVQSPAPWWGSSGNLLSSPSQCQTEDLGPGLHWVTYTDPLGPDSPESVEIVKAADVALLYLPNVGTGEYFGISFRSDLQNVFVDLFKIYLNNMRL